MSTEQIKYAVDVVINNKPMNMISKKYISDTANAIVLTSADSFVDQLEVVCIWLRDVVLGHVVGLPFYNKDLLVVNVGEVDSIGHVCYIVSKHLLAAGKLSFKGRNIIPSTDPMVLKTV